MNSIDLSKFEITFNEEFNKLNASMSPNSGATWYTRTPWNGDFGAASFASSLTDGTFSIDNGVLNIKAQHSSTGKWTSGLISSVDSAGNGFSQKFGYFEMSAKLPTGDGTWPAFWLIGMNRLQPNSKYTAEVDIMEHYNALPDGYTSKLHVWSRDGSGQHDWTYNQNVVENGGVASDFHNYGVLIEEDVTKFYFDGREVWSAPTPAEHKQPMMILADLGIGGGWPVNDTANGATMQIDYIRAYKTITYKVDDNKPDQLDDIRTVANIERFSRLFDIESRENSQHASLMNVSAIGKPLVGTIKDDYILGSGASDRLSGHKGDDIIIGKEGNDQLFGDQGNDILDGGRGDDQLYGGSGNDVIKGGDGNDFLNGGGGIDFLEGGAGADRYIIRAKDGETNPITNFSDVVGQNVTQWVQINGLKFDDGDTISLEFYRGLDSAIGRDGIISNMSELESLKYLLENDDDPQTVVNYNGLSEEMLLSLKDGSGSYHFLEIFF